MSRPAAPPLRHVTPEMRKRTARTFGLILLAFITGVGLLVAVLSAQGREARTYAQAVLRAAGPTSPNASYTRECAQVRPGPLPRGATRCEVVARAGKVTVTLTLEGGRAYRVSR